MYRNRFETEATFNMSVRVCVIRGSALGQSECEHAIGSVNEAIRQLDQASLAAIGQKLTPRPGTSLPASQQQLATSAAMVAALIDPIRGAAKWEAEKLGHLVSSRSSGVFVWCRCSVLCSLVNLYNKTTCQMHVTIQVFT